ncbi:hypothetical protein AXG93_4145s1010 [Marchantia polymorpha subsp. ruderalis]|uniref:Uncharacterized protein n=1 Tax=Marchantia polymorpha subsp. ruderalis TaxID=1480154 RepID=A0A176WPP3_MARPO|nr:hypothetical protein AXG93_4145s1010 [Marchantia polymorpha subsp. ruderalis]
MVTVPWGHGRNRWMHSCRKELEAKNSLCKSAALDMERWKGLNAWLPASRNLDDARGSSRPTFVHEDLADDDDEEGGVQEASVERERASSASKQAEPKGDRDRDWPGSEATDDNCTSGLDSDSERRGLECA